LHHNYYTQNNSLIDFKKINIIISFGFIIGSVSIISTILIKFKEVIKAHMDVLNCSTIDIHDTIKFCANF
jgi:hypothetical protein